MNYPTGINMFFLIILMILMVVKLYSYFSCLAYCIKSSNNKTVENDIQKSLEPVFNDFENFRHNTKYLISYKEGKYIVVMDKQNDLDWEIKENDKEEFEEIMKKIQNISSMADCLCRAPGTEYFSENQRKTYINMLGKAVTHAFDGNMNSARKFLEEAMTYSKERKTEISRKWQIFFSICCFVLCIILMIVFFKQKESIADFLIVESSAINYITHALYSSVGVTLSVIYNSGNLHYDCQSGRMLNFLQIFAKYVIGVLAAVIALLLVGSIIDIPTLRDDEENKKSIIAILAGFSERMVPSILMKIVPDEVNSTSQEGEV